MDGATDSGMDGGTSTSTLVFVMPAPTNHNWGNAASQDGTCQAAAKAAGRTGTWTAWLSDSKTSPAQRFAQSTGDYVLVDGTVVAHGWSGLTSGTILHTINVKADGTSVAAGGGNVWTGTKTDGTYCGTDCKDWTSNTATDTACAGNTSKSDVSWSTMPSGDTCGAAANEFLYCFQQ
jgi:hypothetical protein